MFVCVQNLLMEYDKQGEQLDSEKSRANNLERQIDDLTKQLQVSSEQVSSDLLISTIKINSAYWVQVFNVIVTIVS